MGSPSWGKTPSELTGPTAFKKRAKASSPAYDLSGHCEALEIIGFPKAVAEKDQARGESTVVSEAARERQTPIYGSVEALSTATLHRSPPRGPPPRQVPASRPLAIPNGAPVRWQGGRKARMDETPTQPISFRRRCRRSPKEIQCIRDATLVFGPQRLSRSGTLRDGVTKISSPAPHFKKTVKPCQRRSNQAHIVKLQDHWDFTDCPGHSLRAGR
jgi:hypothetical protein